MLDIISDQNPSFLPSIADALPDYVKSAAVPSADDVASLSAHAFADPVHRLHPIHNKAATVLTAAYLAAHGAAADADEMLRVKKASELFGVSSDVDAVIAACGAFTKSAAAADDAPAFALMVKMAEDDATASAFYPLTTPAQVQDSARDMATDYANGKLPVLFYKSAAVTLMEALPRFGMQSSVIMREVAEMAEERVPDFEKAAWHIGMRRLVPGVAAEHLELYSDIVKSAAADPAQVETCAALIEEIDRQIGVKYAGAQVNPWRAFHDGETMANIKLAAAANVVLSSVMVPTAVFSQVPEKSIRMKMAKNYADVVVEATKIACTNAPGASAQLAGLPEEVQRDVLAITLELAQVA